MRKLMLVGSLCLAGFVLAPVASASAETLTGACQVTGTATFEPSPEGKLLNKNLEKHAYSFEGKAECKGTVEGVPEELKGNAKVKGGDGNLSCLAATSEKEGEGTLELSKTGLAPFKVFTFKLSFTAAGGHVALVIKVGGEVSATGDANFLKSTHQTPAECLTGSVEKLEFEASAAGTI